MRKFWILLKKELREMITLQSVLSIVLCAGIFVLLGNFMGSVTEEAAKNAGEVAVIDLDDSELTRSLLGGLEQSGFVVHRTTKAYENPIDYARELGRQSAIVIPEGFGAGILAEKPVAQKIQLYSEIKSAAVTANISAGVDSQVVQQLGAILSRTLVEKAGIADPGPILEPVQAEDYTAVGEHTQQVSAGTVSGFLSSQTMMVPIIVFLLLMFASQMVVSTIVNEKNDKTLETLLSAPIKRTSILSSKMIAAGLVSLLNAAVFMVGYSGYMGKLMGGSGQNAAGEVLKALGLSLSTGQYLLIGVQLFATILTALTISILLGSLAQDIKAAQTAIMPVMVMVMIPYFICLLADVNGLPTVARFLVYAIPFTHTFMAIPNMMFGNYPLFFFGLGYQVVFFAVCMFLAVRLFSSDKILTAKLQFGKKKSAGKKPAFTALGKKSGR
ncbi:ABC transporter permease [Bittarella massiliensis (ex Durand et al. 2017)]|uniref:ABC transporter permease n=1 Tax=Bittarella massiliensis (ex Durand et al. 2017) TaxID=1720313 RepID=UPI00073EBD88|nr:ABC transporter permease [Bittarella massiliensis (ex Durand et al. 2017)]